MNGQSTSSFYFRLQYRRIIRMFEDNGIYPWLIIPICIIFFFFLTFRLLSNFAFGELIYLMLAVSLAFPLTDSDRLLFLKQISNRNNYHSVRLIEQILVLSPFIIGLLMFKWFWIAGLLLIIGLYFSFGKLNYKFPYSIPTPFGKQPFEFPAGFRKTFPLLILAYALVPIGLSVDNFNLALASIAAIGFIVGGFHTSPEPRFYIWVFKYSASDFLWKKIWTILLNTLLLALPIIAVLLFYKIESFAIILLILLAALAFPIMCMLSKYVSYPQEVNIVQGFAMGGAILFPPIMLVIIPWFYFKALKGLQPVLK